MMMYYYGSGMSGWAMILMVLSNVVFWGLVATGAVAVTRLIRRNGIQASASPDLTPNQVLAQRFARGEIDEDEYTDRLRVLTGVFGGAPR